MDEEFYRLPLKDKIKYLKDKHNLTPFSNPNYAYPKIVATIEEAIGYVDKKIEELKESPTSKGKEGEIKKLMEVGELFEKMGDKESAEKIREKLKEIIVGKRGLFPYLNVKLKFLGISIPVVTVLILAGIGGGVWYLATQTDIFNVTKKLNKYETTMQANTRKVQEYSKKIDNFEKKYSDEFFNTQKKSIDDSITTYQKNLEGQLKSYSDQIGNLKNEIASYKDSYEKFKADNEKYKTNIAEMKKSNEEEMAKLKAEFEKKLEESGRKYDGRIKRLEKTK